MISHHSPASRLVRLLTFGGSYLDQIDICSNIFFFREYFFFSKTFSSPFFLFFLIKKGKTQCPLHTRAGLSFWIHSLCLGSSWLFHLYQRNSSVASKRNQSSTKRSRIKQQRSTWTTSICKETWKTVPVVSYALYSIRCLLTFFFKELFLKNIYIF